MNPGYEVVQLRYSRRLGKSRVELEASAVAYQENVFDDAFELSASWCAVRGGALFVSEPVTSQRIDLTANRMFSSGTSPSDRGVRERSGSSCLRRNRW